MRVLLSFLILTTISIAGAQSAAHAQSSFDYEAVFDDALLPRVTGVSPGYGVVVLEEGQLVFQKEYGYADLEHLVPITDESRFYIASVSKQITAAILAQMVEEELIELADSITSYVDGLSAAYDPVTIADLVYHTGGVREYTSLTLFRGDDPSGQDALTQEQALHLISRQTELDFAPGEQWRYSSAGFVLLTAALENIEGRSLREIAQDRIFLPLGMTSTHFDDNHSELIPDRVRGYRTVMSAGGHEWESWLKHFEVVGDGGLITTLADFALWEAELRSGEILGAAATEMMLERGQLGNGTPHNYGMGQWYGSIKGFEVVRHGGFLGGFIADQVYVPELGLSILVFSNRNDGSVVDQIASTILDQHAQPARPSTSDDIQQPIQSTALPGAELWVGGYFIDERNNRRFVHLDDDGRLAWHDGGDGFITHMVPITEDRYQLAPGIEVQFFQRGGIPHLRVETRLSTYEAVRFNRGEPETLEELQAFTGRYYSEELETRVDFDIAHGAFRMRYPGHSPVELWPNPVDSRVNWNTDFAVWTGLGMVKFRQSAHDSATGFGIGDGRVSNVSFRRVREG